MAIEIRKEWPNIQKLERSGFMNMDQKVVMKST